MTKKKKKLPEYWKMIGAIVLIAVMIVGVAFTNRDSPPIQYASTTTFPTEATDIIRFGDNYALTYPVYNVKFYDLVGHDQPDFWPRPNYIYVSNGHVTFDLMAEMNKDYLITIYTINNENPQRQGYVYVNGILIGNMEKPEGTDTPNFGTIIYTFNVTQEQIGVVNFDKVNVKIYHQWTEEYPWGYDVNSVRLYPKEVR